MGKTVIISEPQGTNSVRIPVNQLRCSWGLGRSGTLSTDVLSSTLVRQRLNGELVGHWIDYLDDDAGRWFGQITNVQPLGDGTTEIGAEDMSSLLAGRLLPRIDHEITGPAGVVARQLYGHATREYKVPITELDIAEYGPNMTAQLDGSDLLSKFDGLARDADQDWWIEKSDAGVMSLHWGYHGTDLSGSVQLCAPRHVCDYRKPRSIDPIVNVLTAYPLDAENQQLQTIVVTNPESIADVGVIQGSAAIESGTTGASIRPEAQGLVDRMAGLGHALEMQVMNIDRCWAWFREGDTICVLLPQESGRAVVRITARSIDNEHDVMDVAATVLQWEARP